MAETSRQPLSALAPTLFLLSLLVAGCGGAEDASFTNPDWREGVPDEVSLPVSEPVTLTVGLGGQMTAPPPSDPILAWLTEKTGVTPEFVVIPSSPGDIEFGEMIRTGELPDIIAEARVDVREPTMHRLFVNFLEFPQLIPNFAGLLAENAYLRQASLAKLTADGELLSLGTFDPDAMPFLGVLAYREDLFVEHDLAAGSWEELTEALNRLKELYPDSYPFGGRFGTILEFMPSWFGSGYDPRHVVYFDTDDEQWKFGPFEEEFRRFVRFLTEAYAAGLLDPNAIAGSDEQAYRNFANDVVFLAPYPGPTGPLFRFPSEDYGGLTDEGEWDGSGPWVSSLSLPPAPDGGPRYVSSQRWSPVEPGWLVYTQGEHVGTALAFLDFLFSEEASAVLALGPPGEHWAWADGAIDLSVAARTAYDEGGLLELQRAIGLTSIGPLSGKAFDAYGLLGYPQNPRFQYFLANDLAHNEPGRDVMVEPGVRIPLDDEEFSSRRIDAVVTLQSHVESQVANFVVGRRPLSEYDEFLEQSRSMGAQRLVDLYNERAVIPDETMLDALLD